LVELANAGGGSDNVTAVVAQLRPAGAYQHVLAEPNRG
jgi:serine/threonine protein phosphatase PrpC